MFGRIKNNNTEFYLDNKCKHRQKYLKLRFLIMELSPLYIKIFESTDFTSTDNEIVRHRGSCK